MNDSAVTQPPELDFDSAKLVRYRKQRNLKDLAAKYSIAMGGISVIVAITLIFFYLLYEVGPLFKSASAEAISEFSIPAAELGESLYMTAEEQGEKAMRVAQDGTVVFFNTLDGKEHSRIPLPIPAGATITEIAYADPASRVLAAALDNGEALIFKHSYKLSYPNDVRVIDPYIEFPYGEEPITLDETGLSIKLASLTHSEEAL